MKFKYLLILIIVTLAGCSTVRYNTDKNDSFSDKAIVFLEAKGGGFSGKSGLKITKINGLNLEEDLSTSKIEFKPDKYTIEFSNDYTSSFIAGIASVIPFVGPAIIIYKEKILQSKIKKNVFDLDLKGGHIYLVSFSYNDDDLIVIDIEEV
jgi:hypothetical protein